jgi:hypothetical protein
LVISGLAGRVVMNTKPMSRREMAIILADILRRIQAIRWRRSRIARICRTPSWP